MNLPRCFTVSRWFVIGVLLLTSVIDANAQCSITAVQSTWTNSIGEEWLAMRFYATGPGELEAFGNVPYPPGCDPLHCQYYSAHFGGSGSAEGVVVLGCISPGVYDYTGSVFCTLPDGTTLNGGTSGTVEVPDPQPASSFSVEIIDPPIEQGNVRFKYSFAPNTAQRYLTLDRTIHMQPNEFSGERILNVAPGTYRASATACLREFWSQTIVVPASPPTVSVTLKKGEVGSDGKRRVRASIDYNMGLGTNWSVRASLVSFKTADSVTYPGGPLLSFVPSERSGTRELEFDPPTGAQQVIVQAVAESSFGKGTGDAAFDCGCEDGSADPVYWADGTVRVSDSDPLPGIAGRALVRTYNSDEQVVAPFGRGFTTVFDRRLMVAEDGEPGSDEEVLTIVTETNQMVIFRGKDGVYRQTWPRAQGRSGSLTRDSLTGDYVHRDAGATEVAVFSAGGSLRALRDLNGGREARVGYDGRGLPATFTDSWTETRWLITAGADRLVTSVAVAGRPDLEWTYSYDAAGNLTAVHAPGGSLWRTYEYIGNRMTSSHDGLGKLLESHTYDANGYGTSSTGPADEIASIEYNIAGSVPRETVTRVTYKSGATAEYALRPSGSAYRPVRITGGCASCGELDATYVRDLAGRVVRKQGADGYITVTAYGADGPSSEQPFLRPSACDPAIDSQRCRLTPDALATASLVPTPATSLVSYEYTDPSWPDQVTGTVTPSAYAAGQFKRESRAYHPLTGAVIESTVSGWSAGASGPVLVERSTRTSHYGDPCEPGDTVCNASGPLAPVFDPGGTFATPWLALAQPAGLRKKEDGPRVDVQDVTRFVYYPVDPSVPALLRGRLAAVRNAAGHVTHYEAYDVFGHVTRTVDANGVVTELQYNALGRLTSSIMKATPGCDTSADPLCATDIGSAYTHFLTGALEMEQRPGGGVNARTYDDRGRLQTESRGPAATDLRERIEYSYDSLTGRKKLVGILAHEGSTWVETHRLSYGYDPNGRLVTITHADGASTGYTYDASGRVRGVRDENHVEPNTLYDYDPAGRLAKVTQKLSGVPGDAVVTAYSYDVHGNLVSVTDPNGNATTYIYDDFGQMLRQSSSVTGVTTYEYDGAGNLTRTVDANGATTTRTYDAVNRVLTATSTHSGVSETVLWTYDGLNAGEYGIGRLSTMQYPDGVTSYAYERRGLVRAETRTLWGATSTQRYEYDAGGNRVSIGYPSGLSVRYAYDYAGRPLSATGTRSGQLTPYVTAATYLPFGPILSLALGNGLTETRTYDERYRPLTNRLVSSAATLAHYVYTTDPAGNVTAIVDGTNAAYNRSFGYDDLNRLTSANTGSALWGSGSFTYDRMGNMLTQTLGGASRTFTYEATTSKLHTASDLAGAMSYDDAGNEMRSPAGDPSDGSPAVVYSPRNLLQSELIREYDRCYEESGSACIQPDIVQLRMENYFDGRGVRVASVERIVSSSIGANDPEPQPALYFYTPELAMLNVVSRTSGRVADVVWFGSRPIADHQGTDVRYTFTDHLGTPILQTSPTGTVVWRVEHEPFGNVHSLRTGIHADDQPLRFPGQQVAFSTAVGEQAYNIFRWYRSGWGRYTQGDPLGLIPGTNLYRYTSGNPVRQTDRLGLFCTADFLKHYFVGKGKAIDLASVGLLSTFTNSPSVDSSMAAERYGMIVAAANKAKELCKNCASGVKSGSFTSSGSEFVNPYLDGTPCVGWPIGSTQLNVTSKCTFQADCGKKTFSATCKSDWKLHDRFTNPFSQGEPDGNPGKPNDMLGTAYDINADWTDVYYGGGNL